MEKNKLVENTFAHDNIIYFIFAYILLMLVTAIVHGMFVSANQLFFVFLAFFVLLCPLTGFRPLDKIQTLVSVKNLLLITAFFALILFCSADNGVYLTSEGSAEKINILKIITFVIFLLYFIKIKNNSWLRNNFINPLVKNKFLYLMIMAVVIRIAIVSFSPAPVIDVFHITNEAVDNLSSGHNPYSASYTPAMPGGYSNPGYLPAVIFMNMPGRIILGDVRFGYIVIQILTALIIYLLLRKKYQDNKIIVELPILMLVFLPNSLFVLEQAWIEPLLLLALFLFALIFIKEKLSYLTCIILGIFISLKQNNFPFLILALASFRINIKKILLILLTIFLPIIPFLIWDFNSFIYATTTYLLNYSVMLHSVSLNSLYLILYKEEMPFYIGFCALLILIIFLILRIKKNSFIDYLHSSVTVMLFFFFLFMGYANYYYFVSSSLVLLITLCLLFNKKEITIKKIS